MKIDFVVRGVVLSLLNLSLGNNYDLHTMYLIELFYNIFKLVSKFK